MTERYYQANSDKVLLQLTTTKEEVIVSLAANLKHLAISLNKEQVDELLEFINSSARIVAARE
jgi:hypothetical protein